MSVSANRQVFLELFPFYVSGKNNTRTENVIFVTIAMLCLCKQIKTDLITSFCFPSIVAIINIS